MRRLLYDLILVLLVLSAGLHVQAQEKTEEEVAADSSNFVTASLVVAAPSEAIYSAFGHISFRMECPAHQLDYVFTYESETDVDGFLTFIAGKAKAKYVAVPTQMYIDQNKREGRGVTQYQLNLTPHEEQELWRLLDEDMMRGADRHFSLLLSNCVLTTFVNFCACLVDDDFEWGPERYPANYSDGDMFRHFVQHSPWAEFLFITFMGTIYDDHSPIEYRLTPEALVALLREAHLVDHATGVRRHVITDKGTTLVADGQQLRPSSFSPMVVFGFLLVLTLLVTLLEWKWQRRKMANVYDVVLFTLQGVVGLVMLYVTFFSELFGSEWNWYLILFNPLPILCRLFFRKKKAAAPFWLYYSVVLACFILATPLLGVLDLPHQLITASLLVRCLSRWYQSRHVLRTKTNQYTKITQKMKMRIWILLLTGFCLGLTPICAQNGKKPVQKREKFEYSFDLPVYVEMLKRELTYPMAWGNSEIRDFAKWKAAARRKVFECMMASPRPAVKFDMKVVDEEKREGYTARRIEFNINAYSRVTAYLLVPDGKGPFPAINALHDHGAHLYIGKEKMIRPFGVEQEVMEDARQWVDNLYEGQFLGDYLASHGYVVLSVDAPLWGERGREEGVDRSKYDIIAGNMMMLGRDLCAFMHYDDLYATDFLATLPEVDGKRIGCVGCSMGAYRSWMLSALTDRVKAAAAICWMVTTDVQMSTADNKREYGGFANCLPGLRQYLDYPHIASLACPKPMLFINGTQDHLFPVRGVKDAFQIMHDTWKSQKADENLTTELWDIPHSCGLKVQQRILQFFDENL